MDKLGVALFVLIGAAMLVGLIAIIIVFMGQI